MSNENQPTKVVGATENRKNNFTQPGEGVRRKEGEFLKDSNAPFPSQERERENVYISCTLYSKHVPLKRKLQPREGSDWNEEKLLLQCIALRTRF